MKQIDYIYILKLLVTVVIVLAVLMGLLIGGFVVYYKYIYGLPRNNSEKKQEFEVIKADFEIVNDYMLENFSDKAGSGDDNIVSLVWNDDGSFCCLYDNGDIQVPDDIKKAFDSIKPEFGAEFSFIEFYPTHINYAGIGHTMYVYSQNGKRPKYYYYPGDGMIFATYKLQDGWYRLDSLSR